MPAPDHDSSRQRDKQAAVGSDSPPRGPGGKLVPILLAGFVVLALVGHALLRQPNVMVHGQELSYDRGMFLAVSSVTLTGFQQSIGPSEFNPDSALGPLIVLTLTVAGSLLAMVSGGWAATRILRLPYSDWQIVRAAFVVEMLAILAGSAGLLGDGRRLSESLQLAASAFGNSGAVVTRAGVGAALPALMNWRTHCLLLPLSVLGGLGLPVIMELYDALFGIRRLSYHARTVLTLTCAIYVASVALLTYCIVHTGGTATLVEANAPAQVPTIPLRQAIILSSVASLDARTVGLPFDLLKKMPVAQWVIALLMMIGANSAGTGGGVKNTTFHTLFTGVYDALRRRIVHRSFGIAATWLAGYLLLAFVGFLMLSASEPQMPADRLFFMTISALSNVGLSHDPVSLSGPGLFLLSLLMLAGRIAPVLVLWWLAMTTKDADLLIG